MHLKEKLYDDIDVISLKGKLAGADDVQTLHIAIKGRLEDKINKIVIDLKDVTWVGSVGIGILICCLTTIRNAGGELRLCGLNDKVKKLLVMTKLDNVFDVYQNTDQAIQSFNKP